MKINREIINKCISILMLVIYLFGSSSVFLFHNHNDDHHHHHHHQELSFCENLYQDSSYDSDCSHDSHIISLKERCAICDYFFNSEPETLDKSITSTLDLLILAKCGLLFTFYFHDSANTLNKSPPFII